MQASNKAPSQQFCEALELLCRTLNPEWCVDADIIDLSEYGVERLALEQVGLNNSYLRGLHLKEDYAQSLVQILGSNLANCKIDIDVHCEQCNLFRTELKYNEPDASKNLIENNIERAYLLTPYENMAMISCSDWRNGVLGYCISNTSTLVVVNEIDDIHVVALPFGSSGAMLIRIMYVDCWVVLGFDGQLMISHKGHRQVIPSRTQQAIIDMAILDQDQFITLDTSGWIRVWNMVSGKSTKTFKPNMPTPIVGFEVIDSERIVILAGGTLFVYHLLSEAEEVNFTNSQFISYGNGQLQRLDNSRIAIMENTGNIIIYNWQEQNLELAIPTVANPGADNTFAINDQLLIVASDNIIEIWNWRENEKVVEYANQNTGCQVYLSDKDALIIGYDGIIRACETNFHNVLSLWALQSREIPLIGLDEDGFQYFFDNQFSSELGRQTDLKTGTLVISEPKFESNIVLYQDGHPIYPYMAAEKFELEGNHLSVECNDEFKETQLANIMGPVNWMVEKDRFQGKEKTEK